MKNFSRKDCENIQKRFAFIQFDHLIPKTVASLIIGDNSLVFLFFGPLKT